MRWRLIAQVCWRLCPIAFRLNVVVGEYESAIWKDWLPGRVKFGNEKVKDDGDIVRRKRRADNRHEESDCQCSTDPGWRRESILCSYRCWSPVNQHPHQTLILHVIRKNVFHDQVCYGLTIGNINRDFVVVRIIWASRSFIFGPDVFLIDLYHRWLCT